MFTFFQFAVAPATPSTLLAGIPTEALIGLLAIGSLLVFTIAILIVRWWRMHRALKRGILTDHVVLRVQVPRFSTTTNQDQSRQELRSKQEDIAVVEAFFSAFGGLKPQSGIGTWWRGRTDHLSFEIVAEDGLIHFYSVVPRDMVDMFTQQMHAQFPNAEVNVSDDYNVFLPTGVVLGSYITLQRESFFPIRTYRQMETDPLYALLNAMAKVPKDQGAAIQFTVRPAKPEWRERSLRFVKMMQEGATVKQALKGKSPGRSTMTVGEALLGNDRTQQREIQRQRKMSPKEEEMVKSIDEKAARAGFDVNARVVVSASQVGTAQQTLANIVNSFGQYNVYEFGNSFHKIVPRRPRQLVRDFVYRHYVQKYGMILNTEELSSLWHPPLPGTETTNIDWIEARKGGAPANVASDGLLLGVNNFRGQETKIYMKDEDRQRHMYMIGKSGSGKTTMMQNLVMQDIRNGHGVCVIDPHGDNIEEILGQIPRDRIEDVIVFSPYDRDMPVGLNMLEAPNRDLRDFAVQEMISIFYKLFPPEMIGPMFEHNMRNVMLTLMSDPENPGTIAEIPRMFSDEEFQKKWVAKVEDPVVRAFWEQEMAKTSDFHKSEMLGYLISKVGRFVEDEMMRNIIGQQRSGFSFRQVMDEQKILLLDLSKGKTGEVNSQLLGLIIVTKLQMAAMARADMPEDLRKDFFLYIDEFQNFVTPSIATILSEARKYRLDLILAHQYMSQVVEKGDTEIRDAILGNVGSMFVSRIGPEDVETFEKVFAPTFTGIDLINSDKYTWYVKMIVDNSQVAPFTMTGLPNGEYDPELAKKVRQLSRLKYGRKRAIVSAEIEARTKITAPSTPPPPSVPREG